MSTTALPQPLCWELLDRHYAKKNRTEDREELQEKRGHAQRVLSICLRIVEALPASVQERVNQELLASAAILHDIAKFDDGKHHHKLAQETIRQEYEDWAIWQVDPPAGQPDFFSIGEVIRCHKKKKFQPAAGLALEASILRMADKIDKVHRKEQKLLEPAGPKKKAKRLEKLQKAEDSYTFSLALVRPYWGENYSAFETLCSKEKGTR